MPGKREKPVADSYRITWLVRRLFRAMAQTANERLADIGISAADRAVMEFLYPAAALSVPEIAERYQVSRQHVQVTVNSLLERKLVTTRRNSRHKRSPLLRLTAKGRELFASIRSGDQATIEALFAGVSQADRERTRRTLETLLERLSKGGPS